MDASREIQRLQEQDGAGPCNPVIAQLQAERDAAKGSEAVMAAHLASSAISLAAAEARVEALEAALDELVGVAPAPPWFTADTPGYVRALTLARAVLAVSGNQP